MAGNCCCDTRRNRLGSGYSRSFPAFGSIQLCVCFLFSSGVSRVPAPALMKNALPRMRGVSAPILAECAGGHRETLTFPSGVPCGLPQARNSPRAHDRSPGCLFWAALLHGLAERSGGSNRRANHLEEAQRNHTSFEEISRAGGVTCITSAISATKVLEEVGPKLLAGKRVHPDTFGFRTRASDPR